MYITQSLLQMFKYSQGVGHVSILLFSGVGVVDLLVLYVFSFVYAGVFVKE